VLFDTHFYRVILKNQLFIFDNFICWIFGILLQLFSSREQKFFLRTTFQKSKFTAADFARQYCKNKLFFLVIAIYFICTPKPLIKIGMLKWYLRIACKDWYFTLFSV
jgi:hypothetical protein